MKLMVARQKPKSLLVQARSHYECRRHEEPVGSRGQAARDHAGGVPVAQLRGVRTTSW